MEKNWEGQGFLSPEFIIRFQRSFSKAEYVNHWLDGIGHVDCNPWKMENSKKAVFKLSMDLFEYDHHIYHVHNVGEMQYWNFESNRDLPVSH